MFQCMPTGSFKDIKPTLNVSHDLTDTTPIGRIYDIYISYPHYLHDNHNDLPFLPQNCVPPGYKIPKLMATFITKNRYVIHYRNLQQTIANGLIEEKVHRVLQFELST